MDNLERTTVRPHLQTPEGLSMSEAEATAERKKSHRMLIVAFVLVAALLGGAAAFVSYGLELWGGHKVPSVVNLNRTRATAELEAAGFVVEVNEVIVDENVGLVLDQTPASGERHEEGTTVSITVGISRTVPAVVGLTVEEAQQALNDAGATNIQIEYQNSNEPENNVLAVNPAEGAEFSSSTTITLTVAAPYVIPDVVGLTEEEATSQLEALGLEVQTTMVESDEDGHKVVAMEPAAGSTYNAGDVVRLSVSTPFPSGTRALAEYFEHRPADIAAFLSKMGFSCQGGYVDNRGKAVAQYSNGSTVIRLCSAPFDHTFDVSGGAVLDSEASDVNSGHTNQGNVVASGYDFLGVRYEYGGGELSGGSGLISLDGVYTVMSQCGLSGMISSCTESSITLPSGQEELATKDGRRFICAYGTQDNYTWTVLIAQTEKDSDAVRVVATYALSDIYNYYDMSRNGNRVCDFAAFVDMYIQGSV